MTLNARQVETAKPRDKAYKLADGGGLYLMVNTNGSKYWRMKYRFAGKEKKLSFGTYCSAPASTPIPIPTRVCFSLFQGQI